MRGRRIFVTTCFLAVLSSSGAWAQQADSGASAPVQILPLPSQPVPRLIMFTGAMKDPAGKPLTGPLDIHFAIYKEQTDGAPLWQETQTLRLDELGRYIVLLGGMTPEGLPLELFSSGQARWLGVSAGTLPEQPRTLLVSVPYALKAEDAEMLGGKPASAYVLAEPPPSPLLTNDENMMPGSSAGSPVAAHGILARPWGARLPKSTGGLTPYFTATGEANYIPMFSDSTLDLGNSAIYQSAGNIGLGTTNPMGLLHVQTGIYRSNLLVVDDGQTSALPPFPRAFIPAVTVRASQTFGSRPFFFGYDNNGSWGGFIALGACAGNYTVICFDQGAGTALNTVFQAHASWLNIGGGAGSDGNFSRITLAPVSGNVGVGTITPKEKLDVAGNINASGNITAAGSITATGSVTAGTITATSFSGSGAGLTNLPATGFTGVVPNANLPPSSLTRGIIYLAGCDSCSVLQTSDSQRQFFVNVVGTMTITSVTCFTDLGSPTINITWDNVQRLPLLLNPLTCSPTGATTTSFSSPALNLGDQLDFVIATTDGVAHRITLVMQTVVN